MSWDERQREMLNTMGLTVWAPPLSEVEIEPETKLAIHIEPKTETVMPSVPLLDEEAPPSDSRISVISHLDWATLERTVAQCTACRLCESRRQTVFGVGHRQAHVMVVGEAPGEQEDRQGQPFVGPAGKLLDNMLQALKLRRTEGEPAQQVFIANTLKCRPPGNRNPELEEMQQCEPFLQRQLALVKPRVILAMGRFAVQALLRSSEPIGRLRERVHHYEGVPLVVTYHPAYLLRNPADKAKSWFDLRLAASILQAS